MLINIKSNIIPGRRRTARGRLIKHETARTKYIEQVGLPNLLRGKFPSVDDERALKLPLPSEVDERGKPKLSKADSTWMDGG